MSFIKTTRDLLVIIFIFFGVGVQAQLIGDFVPASEVSDNHEGRLGLLVAETFNGSNTVIIHNYLFEEDTRLAVDESKIQLNVYPNPVSDVLNIASEEIIKSIVVSDLSGRKLIVEKNLSAKQTDINLRELPVSVVLLTLTFNNDKVRQIKISKVL